MRAGRRSKIESESGKEESLRHISTISTICARPDMRRTRRERVAFTGTYVEAERKTKRQPG